MMSFRETGIKKNFREPQKIFNREIYTSVWNADFMNASPKPSILKSLIPSNYNTKAVAY